MKTYQAWLRAEILLAEDCLFGHACSVDHYSDNVNLATSIVVNSTSSNVADFARYYYIARNMERLREIISLFCSHFFGRIGHIRECKWALDPLIQISPSETKLYP